MFVDMRTITNPTLDASGRITVAFSQFQRVVNAVVSGSHGFVPHIQAIVGNVVTVEVRQVGGALSTPLAALGAGAITGTFRVMAQGI